MSALTCLAIWVFLPLWTASAQVSPPPAGAVAGKDVLAHVRETILWYRHMSAVEQSAGGSGDVLVRESLRRKGIQAVQLAFDFARAETALLNAKPAPAEGETNQAGAARMQRVAARATERVAALESAIGDLGGAIDRAPARSRTTLIAQRQQLAAELSLAKQIQEAVRSLVAFSGAVASDASGSLGAQLSQLERSVPEAVHARQSPPAPASPVNSAPASTPQPESAGVFRLLNELFTLSRAGTDLKRVIEETDTLRERIDQLRAPLGRELGLTIRRSDAMASAPPARDLETVNASRRLIEALGSSFKQLSAAVLPLREQAILLESGRGDLEELRQAVAARSSVARRYLLTRTAILGIAIFLVLAVSQLWRRLSFRYIRDARRRRQFLLVRRLAVAGAIGLVIVLGLVTELGSLATYAGFLTAGLALALQSPILSLVAYFFLIGRYGLRVGDRVTIGGVTGEVIDIGLLRMYLVELAGAGADRHATGRIVVFSNAVLFQPAALFKQIPGTDYLWRTVTLMLAPGADSQLAESRLMAAVESVYNQYRESLEQQHAAFERSVDAKVAPPQPEGRLRLSDAGLEFTARYPAERRQSPEVDDQVLKALRDAIASEPKLTLADGGGPKLLETV